MGFAQVAREERWISELHQPISADYDFEYHESVSYQFAGQRLVLPFKHVRYTSNHSNVSSRATVLVIYIPFF